MAETPYERRQRQDAERTMRRAMPEAEQIMKELASPKLGRACP